MNMSKHGEFGKNIIPTVWWWQFGEFVMFFKKTVASFFFFAQHLQTLCKPKQSFPNDDDDEDTMKVTLGG